MARTRVVGKFILTYTFFCLFNVTSLTPLTDSYLDNPRHSSLNFTARSAKYGYTTDEHTVTTDDGYMLTIFHMHKSRKCSGAARHPPVVMMHGLTMSSDNWIDAGPDAALVCLLSDACFDLWLGNARGNHYGRRHIELDPDTDLEFWNFSTDEMALYDLPATIDYVLEQTGADKVNYIGYSQGGGVMMATCSERPGDCGKARVLIALAPATRLTHTRSYLLRVLASQLRIYERPLSALGIKEVFSRGSFGQKALSVLCTQKVFMDTVCKASMVLLDSDHPGSVTRSTLQTMYADFPAGTSVHTFAHYGQALYSKGFRKFDYGELRNLQLYGTATAPYYNLSAVRTPTVIIHGKNDYLVDSKDIIWLAENLPNVLELAEMEDPSWNHLDFIFSQHVGKFVFPKVLKYLLMFSDS